LFVGLLLALSFLILWTSLGFQECVKAYSADNPSEHIKKGSASVISVLLTWRHCAGAYVLEMNPVITALGTVVIAIFTTILGVFTVRLAQSTRVAADAAKEAAEIARKEFIATNRPRVGVRKLELNLAWENSKPAEAKLTIVNRGDSAAHIKTAHGILYFRSPEAGPGFRYEFDEYQGDIEGCPTGLLAGESKIVKIKSTDTKETADRRLNGKWFIYAAGQIIYTDDVGTRRTTAFLREFKTGIDWVFRPVNDPDYEYED
jgi:hypothetical protein